MEILDRIKKAMAFCEKVHNIEPSLVLLESNDMDDLRRYARNTTENFTGEFTTPDTLKCWIEGKLIFVISPHNFVLKGITAYGCETTFSRQLKEESGKKLLQESDRLTDSWFLRQVEKGREQFKKDFDIPEDLKNAKLATPTSVDDPIWKEMGIENFMRGAFADIPSFCKYHEIKPVGERSADTTHMQASQASQLSQNKDSVGPTMGEMYEMIEKEQATTFDLLRDLEHIAGIIYPMQERVAEKTSASLNSVDVSAHSRTRDILNKLRKQNTELQALIIHIKRYL